MDIIQQNPSDSVSNAPDSSPETMSEIATDARRARPTSTAYPERLSLPMPKARQVWLPSSLPRVLSQIDEHRAAGLFILVFLVNAWLLNIVVHSDWIPVLAEELGWLLSPKLGIPDFEFSFPGLAAVVLILVIGTLAVSSVLQGEQDKGLVRMAAAAFGLGLVGWSTMVAGIVGRLDRVGVNLAIVILGSFLLFFAVATSRFGPSRILASLRRGLAIWSPGRPRLDPGDVAFFGGLLAITIIELYHASSFPILHWDALVYHATMAKLMFEYGGIPTIAGPSVGIQMSANYPALFPALGAFFYVQVGVAQDVYLRLISPASGLLAALFVYKTACLMGGSVLGRAAALFLALSPLFIAMSIYAINYMLAVLFVAAVMFFMVRAVIDGAHRYWLAAGVSAGLLFSTTYQAFFFLPALAIAVLVAAKSTTPPRRAALVVNLLLLAVPALLIGSAWYLRNLAIVGNPIFPFGQALLGGKNIDPTMLARSVAGIKADSIYNFFGDFEFSPLDLPRFVLLNKSHFPAISAITLFGLVLAFRQKNRPAWVIVLAFGLVPLLIVSSAIANIFPRYFVFAFPGLALVSALPLAQAAQTLARPLRTGDRTASRTRLLASNTWQPPSPVNRTAILAFTGFMIATAIFPSSFALFSGQAYQESDWQPPYDPMLFLQHPSQETSRILTLFYGPDPTLWQWLDQHLGPGRVATFENKVYYFDSGVRDSVFYFDGWEAHDFYGMTDPAAAVRYLAQNGARYVLDPSWIHHWIVYGALPLDRYLGMPQYFPIVKGTSGETAIYNIGRMDDPVTVHSPLALAHQPSELTNTSGGASWQIPGESVAPRLLVETPTSGDKVSIEISYLDRGKGTLTVNRRTGIGWAYGESVAQLGDSGRIQVLRFSIPVDRERGYTELGLFATPMDVLVTGIRAQVAK